MAEDRWVLTDKEMMDIIGEDKWNYTLGERAEFQMIAVVQDAITKRKLVEWIDKMGEYSLDSPVNTFKIPKDDWQVLRKELGLNR